MAEERIVVDFDDRALFQSALQDVPPPEGAAPQPPVEPSSPAPPSSSPPVTTAAPTSPSAPPPAPGQQPRDDLGRFMPASAQPQQPLPQAPQPQTPPAEDPQVPSWRLREEREQREAYAARLAERERQLNEAMAYIQSVQRAQQPAAVPDPLLNPAEWNAHQAQAMQQFYGTIAHQIKTNQLESNLQLTRLERKPEVFDEAYNAFMRAAEGDVAFARSIVNSPNPGAAMCDWYTRAKALATYGDDPEAYFNQRVEALLSDRTFLARAIDAARGMATGTRPGAAPPSNNVTVLPPSLSTMRSGSNPESGISNAVVNSAGEDLMSDQMLFQAALAPGQARR